MVGWHHWLNSHEFEQAPGIWWRTGKPGVLQSMGSQRVGQAWASEQQLQQLVKNVTLVSGVKQNDSVMHIYISVLFQILFPITLLQNIEQNSVPCTKSLLVLHFKYSVCTCWSQTPNYPFPPTFSPLVTIICSQSMWFWFCFCKYLHLYHFLKVLHISQFSCSVVVTLWTAYKHMHGSAYKQYHMIFLFLSVTHFTQYDT